MGGDVRAVPDRGLDSRDVVEMVLVGGRCSRGSEARAVADYRLLYAWMRPWGIVVSGRAAEALATRTSLVVGLKGWK